MAFPADPLDVSVEFAFGADPSADPSSWTWTDATADAKARVVVRRGRQSEDGDRLSPGVCLFRLNNPGGKYTPGHPMSPYWPDVRRDTPLRAQVNGVDRATQFVGDFRPGFDDSGGGPWEGAPICDVEAGGILRRLGQGDPPVYSPYRRSIMSPVNTGLLAYWPGEDDRDADQVASAIPGQPGMTTAGTVVFGDAAPALSVTGVRRFGTMPLPDLTGGGSLTGAVPLGSSSPVAWAVQFFSQSVDFGSGVANALTIASWRTPGGTYDRWELHQDQSAGGSTRLRGIDSSGVSTDLIVLSGVIVGPDHYTIDAVQNGANIDVRLWFATFLEGSFSGAGTLARIAEFSANPNRTVIDPVDEFIIGHIRVWDHISPPKMTITEVLGWSGTASTAPETATERLARLCVEDGVSLSIPTVSASFETPMGPQPDGTALDLYRQCADADQGVLYESGFGLAYLPRQHRYNRPVALTLEKRHLATSFRTSVDDSTTRNDVTVARPGGSSARRADEEHIAAHGRYTGGGPTRLASDDVLAEHAAWQVHLGTGEEIRYPKVTLNLHADPTLIPAWLACDIGSRIRITEAPDSLPPGEIDLIIDGWVETLDALEWTVELNCSPASPWNVFVLGDSIYGRLDTSGSELAASADSTETSLLVATDAGKRPWITTGNRPQDFPLNVNGGGEIVQLRAVGEILNVNPFFDVDVTGWTGQAAGLSHDTVTVHPAASGVLFIAPDGVAASGGAIGDITAVGSITPGVSYTVCMWARSAGGWSDLRPAVDWHDAAGAFLSSGLGTGFAVPAGEWTFLTQTLVAPANASRARMRARHGGTPSQATTWRAWAVQLVPAGSDAVSPQTFTVVRSVNGIVKAHTAGTRIRLSRSAVGL